MKKLLVYVSGPISGTPIPEQAVREIVDAGKAIIAVGHVPLILPYSLWSDTVGYWIARCDAVVRLPGAEKSDGCDHEKKLAEQYSRRIYTMANFLGQMNHINRCGDRCTCSNSWDPVSLTDRIIRDLKDRE